MCEFALSAVQGCFWKNTVFTGFPGKRHHRINILPKPISPHHINLVNIMLDIFSDEGIMASIQ